jgi:hypothetical protein
MSMTAVKTRVDKTQNSIIVDGTITLAGDYVTNGVTLDLSKLGIPSNQKPLRVQAWSTVNQGAAVLQDFYTYVPGTNQTDGVLQIAVANAEMAAAAFAATSPCNAAGYVLNFRAEFPAFV